MTVVDETQATETVSNGMSISAIRSVIKERIDNDTIEDILKLHHTGMTPARYVPPVSP